MEQLGTTGTGAGQLGGPVGVAFGPDGNLYVSEYDNHRVSVFSPAGAFLRAFGDGVDPDAGDGFEVCTTTTGCKEGELTGAPGALSNPAGIAFDSAGNLYVTESTDHRVSVFSTAPAFLRAFGENVDSGGGAGFEVCTTACVPGSESDAAGGMDEPYAVAVDADGTVYVAEYDNHRVSIFSPTPAFLAALGKNVDSSGGGGGLEVCVSTCQAGVGDGTEGSLFGPDGLTIDPAGNLQVVEFSNHRVSVIEPETGSFLGTYGLDVAQGGGTGFEVCEQNCQAGNGSAAAPGSFGNPVGILWEGNRIFVADQDGNQVVVLSDAPGYLHTFGANVIPGGTAAFEVCSGATGCQTGAGGPTPGAVDAPQFIAADGDGRLYVAEYDSDRVEVFAEALSLGKVKRNKRKGTAKLRVNVTGSGDVELRRTSKVTGDEASVAGAGDTLKLLVKARGAAKRKLRGEGSVRVRAKVTFAPLGGDPLNASKRIKLKLK